MPKNNSEMANLLLEKVEYKVEETTHGVWRRYLYTSGECFVDFQSHMRLFGLPLLHYTRGKCPETGKRLVAKGFIAVGRLAMGVVAIGQASAGIIAFGQASLGLLFCLAQAGAGLMAAGQLALGALIGVGQVATGVMAIGQLAAGHYVLAQFGYGEFRWTSDHADTVAVQYFQTLWNWLRSIWGPPA